MIVERAQPRNRGVQTLMAVNGFDEFMHSRPMQAITFGLAMFGLTDIVASKIPRKWKVAAALGGFAVGLIAK